MTVDVRDPDRDYRPRLLTAQCTTCIFRSARAGGLDLGPERLAEFVREAVDTDSYVPCHSTYPPLAPDGVLPAICRGFHDRYPASSVLQRLALTLDAFLPVNPPEERRP